MRRLILLLTLSLTTLSFSQTLTRVKGRFYADGEQITTRQTRQFLSANVPAATLFKKAKNKESFGGILIGVGGALVVADVVVGLVSDVNYPTAATYIGGAALIASIPVLWGKNKKADEALEFYNQSQGQKKLGARTHVELNVVANQRGYGLQLRF